MPGRVAPARSGLPPRGLSERGRSVAGLSERGRSVAGLSERGRSVELLCGREFDLAAEGRPEGGLPLGERDDVDSPLAGLEEGRDPPLAGGRCASMSLLHSQWYKNIIFDDK